MHCPYCRADNDRVLDSRAIEDGRSIRRRRYCNQCKERFTTYERVETFTLQVVKKDQAREPFQREKIERGVERACWKRPVSTETIRQLAASVESEIQTELETEVPSERIGRLVMEGLAKIDQVAYVRFASVYREFKDVADFVAELQPMVKPAKPPVMPAADADGDNLQPTRALVPPPRAAIDYDESE